MCLKCIVLFYSSEPIRETRACLRAIRMLSECGVLCCDVSTMRGYQVSSADAREPQVSRDKAGPGCVGNLHGAAQDPDCDHPALMELSAHTRGESL